MDADTETWERLFERAADYGVTTPEVRDALRERRDSERGNAERSGADGRE